MDGMRIKGGSFPTGPGEVTRLATRLIRQSAALALAPGPRPAGPDDGAASDLENVLSELVADVHRRRLAALAGEGRRPAPTPGARRERPKQDAGRRRRHRIRGAAGAGMAARGEEVADPPRPAGG